MSTLKQLTLDNSTQTAVTEHSTIHRVCDNLACHAVLSDHLAYDNHYALLHKNACSNCAKQFLNQRYLDIHLLENHDSFFKAQAKQQNMYVCFVDGCSRKFSSDTKRYHHLNDHHMFPQKFCFYTRKPLVKQG